MTLAKPIFSVLTAPSSVMSFLRSRFGAPTDDRYVPAPKVEQPQRDTEVEREDSYILNRVRSALYDA